MEAVDVLSDLLINLVVEGLTLFKSNMKMTPATSLKEETLSSFEGDAAIEPIFSLVNSFIE
jgi:hypothetical protein